MWTQLTTQIQLEGSFYNVSTCGSTFSCANLRGSSNSRKAIFKTTRHKHEKTKTKNQPSHPPPMHHLNNSHCFLGRKHGCNGLQKRTVPSVNRLLERQAQCRLQPKFPHIWTCWDWHSCTAQVFDSLSQHPQISASCCRSCGQSESPLWGRRWL